MENATYKPKTPMETTAVKATGLATSSLPTGMLTVTMAGSVMMIATTTDAITPYTGTLLRFSFDHNWPPGTAPSRLNANSMRVVLVMQATVQKNCPIVAMPGTALAQFAESA